MSEFAEQGEAFLAEHLEAGHGEVVDEACRIIRYLLWQIETDRNVADLRAAGPA